VNENPEFFLRPKITPIIEDGGSVLLIIEWITTDRSNTIVKNEAGEVHIAHREKYRFPSSKLGCSVVPEVGLPAGVYAQADLLAMHIDPQGLRHMMARLDPAEVGTNPC